MFDSKFMFKLLLFVSFFSTLLFFSSGFFSTNYDISLNKYLFNHEQQMHFEMFFANIFAVFSFLLMIGILFINYNVFINHIENNKLLIFYILCFFSYGVVIDLDTRKMFFFGIVSSLFFYLSPRSFFLLISFKDRFNLILVLLGYLLIPLFIYFVFIFFALDKLMGTYLVQHLYVVDSFRGIAFDRVQYGFLCGLVFLLVFIEKGNIKYAYFLMVLICIGLFMAMSRASIVALFLSLLVFLFLSRVNIKHFIDRNLIVGCGLATVFVVFSYFFSHRMDLFSDGGGRAEIIKLYIEALQHGGYQAILFGFGDFYTTYHSGLYPHNSVLQSVLNFGIFITILWIMVLYRFFIQLGINGKSLFIYVISFCMFHPNFSAFVFLPVTFFSYMCILSFNETSPMDCQELQHHGDK